MGGRGWTEGSEGSPDVSGERLPTLAPKTPSVTMYLLVIGANVAIAIEVVPFYHVGAKKISLKRICAMWANLAVSVTLLPMLFHSIMGCCWHHTHSGYQSTFFAERSVSEACCGHKHEHRHNQDRACHSKADRIAQKFAAGSEQPEPCQHHEPCDGVDCVYLTGKVTHCSLRVDMYEQVATLNGNCIVVPGVTETAQKCEVRPKDHHTSSEHCALTQVWII